MTVNGVSAEVGDGTFLVTNLPLVRGPNAIEAVATDTVGNVGRHAVTVTFQPPVGLRVTEASGNGQSAVVKETLPQPLVAQVTDDFGNPVAGRIVRLEVTRNSGTIQAAEGDAPNRVIQIPTDGSGRAAVLFSLGDTAGMGNNRVRATALGVAGEVEFCASGQGAGPEQILAVTGDNQRGVVNHPLATPLEALVVDADGNPVNDLAVTFSVLRGGGTLDGAPTVVQMTGTEGVARAVLTLGPDPGVGRHLVSATFDGFTGRLAAFTATGVVPGNPASTAFSAAVLDNSQTPIPGAAVTIPDTTVSGLTDEDGQFLLTNVPVGRIHLRIDPTGSPRPETFTPLEFETVTVAGRVNTLGQPILIPALDTASSKIVGGTEDVTLEMTGVAGLTRTVFANSVTFPDGSPTGALTISQVHLDKVPMAPPGGSIFMSPAWTIQPAGVTFDPPARITIPNNGLPPGRVIDLFQFDHDLNMFIGVGTGTVSADGSLIVSDPGFGITAAGWGGGRPTPPATTSVPHCGQCEVARGNPTVCERISIVNVDAKADARDALVRPIDRAINFTATVNRGNCTSVQFVWDFGDGTTSTEQNPTHTFADPGVYNVTVTAKCGTCSEKTDSVQVTAVKVEISDVVRGPGLPPSVSPTKMSRSRSRSPHRLRALDSPLNSTSSTETQTTGPRPSPKTGLARQVARSP